jgi:hypothetical protein
VKTELLSLNRDEIMVLTDRVQNGDCGTDEKPLRPYDLLLKLGSAYLESVTLDGVKGPEVPIAVSEPEAWLLRSKVSSSDKMATDPLFGVRLLRKIYEVLERYNDGLDLPVVEDVREERDAQSIKEALTRWRESQDGRTSSNSS